MAVGTDSLIGTSMSVRVDELHNHDAYIMKHARALELSDYSSHYLQQRLDSQHLKDGRSHVSWQWNDEDAAICTSLQRYTRRLCRTNRVQVECCPVSNARITPIHTPNHPARLMIADGIHVVLGSDDPAIFDSTFADDIALATQHIDDDLQAWQRRALASHSECLRFA